MPSLKDIRKRIGSVKSTQQITRAMKLVAAAKLKRATDRALAARPYAEALDDILKRLAAEDASHPLMEGRDAINTTAVVLVTSDKGLCGSFNGGLVRKTKAWIGSQTSELQWHIYGRKGRDFTKREGLPVTREAINRDPTAALDEARALAAMMTRAYINHEVDEVILVYNSFVSVMTQRPSFIRLLPISSEGIEDPSKDMAEEAGAGDAESLLSTSFVFEPDEDEILARLLPLYLETRIYQVFLESVAGEFAARMRAMDSATRNAGDLISSLTLKYNRARQAAITKELVEIVSGAEAL